jgi:hypothetical protein
MAAVTRDPGAVLAMVSAYRLSQVVCAAAELGLADELAAGPRSVSHLAQAANAHEQTLARLLRALAWHGLLADDGDGSYELTPLGSCLRSDDPSGVRQMVLGWSGLPEMYASFGKLADSVRTGTPGFELSYAKPFYEYIGTNGECGARYEAAMESTAEGFEAAIAAHDFSGYRSVVDVGGGRGALLTCLLRREPALEATLFELPETIASAREDLAAEIAERITLAAGDARDSVPEGGDAYILSTVARCFDDERCATLLSNVATAMADDGHVLLLEMIVPDEPVPIHALADLQAFMFYGGGDRTRAEWAGLLTRAGLRLEAVEPADGPYSWLVATRAGALSPP